MKKVLMVLLVCMSMAAFAQQKPGYSIAEITILDKEGYQKELWPKIQKLVIGAGAEVIVAGGRSEAVSGISTMSDRVTVIKFKNMQSAKDFYASKPYQALKPLAEKCVKVRLYIVEGE